MCLVFSFNSVPDTVQISSVSILAWVTLVRIARFKRRSKVKTKNAPPFKMFLFIFREASEKKIFKKMKFSGRLSPFFKVVILPCKISLKMLQNTKNGIAPPNGVQSKNRFHGWISRWILTYLDPKSVSIPQKWPILEPCNFLQLPSKPKILQLSKISNFWGIETLFGSK